jgi:hypothetical protein
MVTMFEILATTERSLRVEFDAVLPRERRIVSPEDSGNFTRQRAIRFVWTTIYRVQ